MRFCSEAHRFRSYSRAQRPDPRWNCTGPAKIAGPMIFPLRQTIEAVALVVWGRHFGGAARTFKLPEGERPSPTIYFFSIATVVLGYGVFNARLETRLVIPGLVAFVGSLALFEWTRQSVRGKFFSYIYSNDTPEFLWTSGPYAYIRNPFYTSYLLSY